MFGSMNLYDNVAFPLREHTRKTESDIRAVVMEKMELVEAAPKAVLEKVNKEAAEKAKASLEGAGATVSVK
jgi:ABC-type transporter Mla maintaining outer membrane lipid asymmetry ATPase subunit MlaF